MRAGGSGIGILLLTLVLLLGAAFPAQADDCSQYPGGILDGFAGGIAPSQIKIDRNCTIRNFPGGMSTNFSFEQSQQNPGPWLVIFDNVVHTGQMACNAVADHKIWFTNGSSTGIHDNCQNLLIPVEKISKLNPAGTTTAAIGVPFTYKLIIPVLFDPATGTVIDFSGSPNDLHAITVWDDLNATGVDLTYVSHTVKWLSSGADILHSFTNVGGFLTFDAFDFPFLPKETQFVIEITVVLDDTPANAPGTQFINTAKWDFGRLIDGVFYEPLPGEWGISPPMTIAAPQLVVTKTGPATLGRTLNLGQWGQFAIDVQNTGLSDAWDVTILDRLPDGAAGGMCNLTPQILSAQVFAADGVTPVPGKGPLVAGTDYTLSYSGAPTCELTLTMLTAKGVIGPDQRLIISYRTQLDADSQDGITLTNVAGATQWFNGDSSNPGRVTFTRTLTDGTVGVADHEDAHTVTVALFGYFFEKSVADLTSGMSPAPTAAAGDTLRYTLRLQSTDVPLDDLTFYDDLGELNASAVFVPGSLTLVAGSIPPGADASNTNPSGGTNGAGILDIRNLDVPANSQVLIQFDITLDPTLSDGTVVLNQADLISTVKIADSDDPNINGQADPEVAGDEDPTQVVIAAVPPPAALLKANTQATAAIGEQFSYQITVPTTPYTFPMYDVRITDDLTASSADLRFVSVSKISGSGSWTPVNTGTDTNLVIEDPAIGIDIPAGQQIVVEVTVVLEDTPTNVAGLTFTNTADYTYNRLDEDDASQRPGSPGTTPPMTVVEPALTLEKSGPAQMTIGTPATFTLNVHNASAAPAWNPTILDRLPDGATGGMCDAAPTAVTAQVFQADGVTPVSGPLVQGTDFALSFSGPAACEMTLSILSAAGTLGADQRLIVSYQTQLDANTQDGTPLTNVAGATQWFSADGASQDRRTYTRTLTDGTPSVLDHQDAHTVLGMTQAPSLFAAKSVSILVDGGTQNVVDPGDVLRYTITVHNSGNLAATAVTLTDSVPANTTYVADSTTLNGLPVGQPDGGVSPLAAGIPISSADLTPPLPGPGAGTISIGQTATLEFQLQVDNGVPGGTVISNQAVVASDELPDLPTDGDGNPATGPEPTVVVVGNGQQLLITKQVAVVGGGAALAGSVLEYVVTVLNVALVPALDVVITDDLSVPTPGQLAYLGGSATLDGSATGVSFLGSLITADYSGSYGPLQPNASVVLRFRATIDPGLATGTTVTNIGVVTWNTPQQSATASVSIDVGGTPGIGALNGTVWHDADFDDALGAGERPLEGWTVELVQAGGLLQSAITDASGTYAIGGVAPNDTGGEPYELRFRAPGAGANTARLGRAASAFTNGLQEITGIVVPSGSNLQNLDLPIDPNGVVYASIQRAPVAGATLTLLNANSQSPLPTLCFDDPVQQGQVTLGNGWYKFDLNFSDAACPSGGSYLIAIAPPGSSFSPGYSQIIPPTSDASTAPLSVPTCPGSANDALPSPAGYCEAQPSELAPLPSAGTTYHVHLLLDGTQVPGSSQIFNNHIPLDPVLEGLVGITKTTPSMNVSRGQLVPYEITFTTEEGVVIPDLSIIDRFPAGFSYVKGSAQVDGVNVEPTNNGQELLWTDIGTGGSGRRRLRLLLAVGAGVGEGEFVNRAQAISSSSGVPLSSEASATVRVIPDPTFDCTDVLGKVFDDANRNGFQDRGERGLPGVRLVTARGLVATTDPYGRFHITCALVPREDRGSNFVLKLDDRTLPSGFRMTNRPLQVQRATSGKVLRFHFGASIQRVVGMDMADAVFEPGSTEMRPQWKPRIEKLLEELRKQPAILRLSYVGDVEDAGLVERRLSAVKQEIKQAWKTSASEPLTIETEVFWRRGAPLEESGARLLDPSSWESLLPSVDAGPPVLEAKPGTAVERHLPSDQPFTRWAQDPERLETESGDRLVKREVHAEQANTVKLKNVVPPIRFESGVANIPVGYVERLRSVLDSMRHLHNVRLHLVGHADDQPLSPGLSRVFGDNQGLSEERAGEVAEHLKTALGLPPEAISFSWAGDTQPIASNATPQGRALNRRVEVEVWYDEIGEKVGLEEVVVPEEIKRVKVCRTETVCKLRYREGHERRARVRNLIAPLHFGEEAVEVPEEFVQQVGQTLHNLRDKQNVTVKFIGFTDDVPLTGRAERIYGTHLALSKARAHRVALAIQDALKLPSSAIASDGVGATRPLASNETERGRALNRRVEVEFWHDDPLQELPDEPQPCPDEAGTELVTKVYDPPWGPIPSLQLVDGEASIPPGYSDALRRAMSEVADKTNVRLRFVGYTKNERLDRRTALVYGDDIGLSASRARRAMERIQGELGLSDSQAEHEGRGYVHSDDVVNAGFLQGETSHVVVQVVYDELALRDDNEGIDATRITRELKPKDPLALNLMRITVDGEPIDDPGRSSADIQRCTDVALERADIQFRFDGLESVPRLSVTSDPISVAIARDGTRASAVHFRMYTNYPHFIQRSEVRIFEQGQSLQAEPLAVVPVDAEGLAQWHPGEEWFEGPVRNLKFLLRAYDAEGRFDETAPQSLWMRYGDPPELRSDALLGGYGESGPSTRNIPLGSTGAVKVHGSGIPPEHTVWLAGAPVPLDAHGNFVAEAILPSGMHTVEVAVIDQAGNGELFLRDLEFEGNEWFYVAIADLTLAPSLSGGAPHALDGGNAADDDALADGRLAFFLSGRFGENWKLAASADTREEPVKDLFTNFLDKAPESLFRRIDPDYTYPTFGDDGTVDEIAPTQGKFYVKLSKDESHALWGDFKARYLENELAQVDRGLYGANLRFQPKSETRFGEKRLALDGFVAEPGTVPSQEEFRGTGGSLYYLRRQDLLRGSERVRIEMRDKDSRLVTGVVHLRPTLDYDIDYLQGRILLTEPISATEGDGLLIRSQGLSGDEAWLVVQYEYTPGFDQIDALATGGQGHYWLNDFIKLGLTANHNEVDQDDSNLYGADLTMRRGTESWLKLQAGRSEGLISPSLLSDDGGFSFFGAGAALPLTQADANAFRADISIGASDFVESRRGDLSLYAQRVEGGYSSPGMTAFSDTNNIGGTLLVPVTQKLSLTGKADWRDQQESLDTMAAEVDLAYQLTKRWNVAAGVRSEDRGDASPVVPLTQEEGSRTDAGVQVGFDPKGRWRGYGFGQMTLAKTGDREDNGRLGLGYAYRLNEDFLFDGEVSHGNLGPAVKLGTSFQQTENTRRYLSYAYENERSYGSLNRRGGSLISGVKTRLSDSSSVFLEDRFQHGESATGLLQAMGMSLAPSDRWSFSGNFERGTLINWQTNAETKRTAGGARLGYGYDKLQLSSGIEYRFDEMEQLDESWADRMTWLFRNSLRYQATPDARVVAKFNHSFSDSSLGQFYDGGYTEAVLGLAYRPVLHDRLHALAKYTYLYNVPTADQVYQQNIPIEVIQKSHVVSLDVTYDLTRSFSLGGKYAYRLGQVSLDRENRDFFANDAHLFILRGDWRFLENWEGSVEGRTLGLPDLNERRSGAVFTIYRYLGDHFKVGVGYNFTDYSEDLTDLSYDHHGLFFNLVGTM